VPKSLSKLEEILREAISNVTHHPSNENQYMRLGSVPNQNSQANSSFIERLKPLYHN